jgi:hypothetical protein
VIFKLILCLKLPMSEPIDFLQNLIDTLDAHSVILHKVKKWWPDETKIIESVVENDSILIEELLDERFALALRRTAENMELIDLLIRNLTVSFILDLINFDDEPPDSLLVSLGILGGNYKRIFEEYSIILRKTRWKN